MNKSFKYFFSQKSSYVNILQCDGIYSLHNLVNDKRYIGYSCRTQDRVRSHIYLLKSGKHAITDFQMDYDKGDLFEIEILCSLENGTYMNHLLLEKYFILKYDSVEKGYNRSYNSYGKDRAIKDVRKNMHYILAHIPVTLV